MTPIGAGDGPPKATSSAADRACRLLEAEGQAVPAGGGAGQGEVNQGTRTGEEDDYPVG